MTSMKCQRQSFRIKITQDGTLLIPYYIILTFSVCLSICLHHFHNLSVYSQILSEFCIYNSIRMSGLGLIMSKIFSFLTCYGPFQCLRNVFWPLFPLLYRICGHKLYRQKVYDIGFSYYDQGQKLGLSNS